MNKRINQLAVLTLGWVGGGYLLRTYDPVHYTIIAAKLRWLNDSARNVHQHVRLRELYRNAHGEVVELNAGAGNTLPMLPPTVTRYYANETNPALIPQLKKQTFLNGLPISHVELCTSLELLRAMGSNTMDTVIMNGALRHERPGQTQRLLNEVHRVLRPGGSLLFAEDIFHQNQLNPFQRIRRLVRNFYTNENQSDFIPPLLKTFDSAYVEDWSRPPLGWHDSHRQTVRCVLDYHQRHNGAENLGEYEQKVPKWDLSFLHRPFYGGWTVKKTTAKGDGEVLQGRVSLDKLHEFTTLLRRVKNTDTQDRRETKAKEDGYRFDTRFVQQLRASQERKSKKKPTQPKNTYPELQPIPVTVASLFADI